MDSTAKAPDEVSAQVTAEERLRALVFTLWNSAVLSEGQVARWLGVDRLTARELRDTWTAEGRPGVPPRTAGAP